ncbi:protein GRINL1A [Paroedura picta]|uniref:protein GRINL1A n=1 Tax=Paroedura picta TaxID=143630 RepID=UPI004056BB15
MAEPEALRGKSQAELQDLLRRQERLRGDPKFISRLPDKGKKISDFVEKLKVAIAHKEEERRRMELLSTVRLAFQKRQDELNSSQCGIAASKDISAGEDLPRIPALHANEELGLAVQNQPGIWTAKTRAGNEPEPAQQVRGDSDRHQEKESVSKTSAPLASSQESAGRSREALAEALERISIGGKEHRDTSEKELDAEFRANPFQGLPQQTPKTPLNIEVLERRPKKKSAFRPNRIPAELSKSSHSSSEAPSPGAGRLPVSAEDRLRREKQHLDDITSARLPLLSHAPAQLLSLEESITLQVQQKAAYEGMQARFAAQKLAQQLGIKMAAYEPEGEAGVTYREAKDEDGYSSAED